MCGNAYTCLSRCVPEIHEHVSGRLSKQATNKHYWLKPLLRWPYKLTSRTSPTPNHCLKLSASSLYLSNSLQSLTETLSIIPGISAIPSSHWLKPSASSLVSQQFPPVTSFLTASPASGQHCADLPPRCTAQWHAPAASGLATTRSLATGSQGC